MHEKRELGSQYKGPHKLSVVESLHSSTSYSECSYKKNEESPSSEDKVKYVKKMIRLAKI